jgi:hypothetical protein
VQAHVDAQPVNTYQSAPANLASVSRVSLIRLTDETIPNLQAALMKEAFRIATLGTALVTVFFCGSGCDSSESEDVTLPNVAIKEPADGQWLDGATPLFVRVGASELSGIATVRINVDGVFVGEDTTEPYEIRWDPSSRADNGTHVITATAIDTEGDEASDEITVGLSTLVDTWTVVAIEDENGGQTSVFEGRYSGSSFDFSDTGTFTLDFVEAGTGSVRGFDGSYKATSGGVGSSLSITFSGPIVNTSWGATYTWDDGRVAIEGPASDVIDVLGIPLTGIVKITMEVVSQ